MRTKFWLIQITLIIMVSLVWAPTTFAGPSQAAMDNRDAGITDNGKNSKGFSKSTEESDGKSEGFGEGVGSTQVPSDDNCDSGIIIGGVCM